MTLHDEASRPDGMYICIRQTLNWADEAQVRANLNDDFRPKMAIWNDTFGMPYHVFRHRLKLIAQTSLQSVRHAQVTSFEKTPAGAIVAPIDDDDWFAPDLADHLLKTWTPAVTGWCWHRTVLEARRPSSLVRRLIGPYRPPTLTSSWGDGRFSCGTNNYALIKTENAGRVFESHTRASDYVDAHPESVQRLSLALGVQNRNISSQTILGWRRPPIPRRTLMRRYRRYQRLYAHLSLAPELTWAEPYIEDMRQLMEELLIA